MNWYIAAKLENLQLEPLAENSQKWDNIFVTL